MANEIVAEVAALTPDLTTTFEFDAAGQLGGGDYYAKAYWADPYWGGGYFGTPVEGDDPLLGAKVRFAGLFPDLEVEVVLEPQASMVSVGASSMAPAYPVEVDLIVSE